MFKQQTQNKFNLETAKKEYETTTALNAMMANTARILFSRGHIIDMGITARQNKIQASIDLELYRKITLDANAIEKAALNTDHFSPSNIFHYVGERLVDTHIPIETRMIYAKTLTSVTSQYFQDLSSQVNHFQSAIIDINDNQKQLFNQMRQKSHEFSQGFSLLTEKANAHQIDFSHFREQLRNKMDQATKSIATCQHAIGEIKLNQAILLNDQTTLSKDIANVQNMMNVIFDAYTTIDIQGFENEASIEKLHNEVIKLKTRQSNGENVVEEIVLKNQELKSQKVQVATMREKFTENLNIMSQSISGLATLANLFGENELGYQIATAGQATISIVTNIAGMMGRGVLAGSMNPLLAIGNIGMAVNNLVDLFKPQKSAININAIILEAVKQLSYQIHFFKQEMQEQFAAVSHMLIMEHVHVLERFDELRDNQLDIMDTLRLIYFEVKAGFAGQESMLSMISQILLSIEKKLDLVPYNQDLDNLKKYLRLIYDYTAENYNSLSNDLDDIGLTRSLAHQIDDPMVLLDIRSPSNFLHCTKYFAHLIRDTKLKLNLSNDVIYNPDNMPNALLLVYACFSALLLNIKEYPQHATHDERERISKNDIVRMKRYLTNFENIAQFFSEARDPALIKHFIIKYDEATNHLANVIQEKSHEIETTYTLDKKFALDKIVQQAQAESLDKFRQNFEIGTYGWFEGNKHHEKRSHYGRQWHWPITNEDYIDTATMGAYIKSKETKISNQRKEWIKKTSDHLAFSKENYLSAYGKSKISPYHGIRFIKSINGMLPDLPAPDPLIPADHPQIEVMSILQEAQALGVGYIELSYATSKRKNQFTLNIDFILFDQGRKCVGTIEFKNYYPLFYQEAEAVWNYWLGGTIALRQEGVIQSKVIGLKLTEEQALNDQGYGHKNGEFEYTEWTFPTPKESSIIGKIEAFENVLNLKNQNAAISTDSDTLALIKQAITEHYTKFEDHYTEEFIKHLDIDRNNKLGKACRDFEIAYRNIYGLFSHAYHDTMLNPESKLAQWFARHFISIAQLKKFIAGRKDDQSPLHILSDLNGTVCQETNLSNLIPITTINNIFDPDFNLLMQANSMLEAFIVLYEPYAVLNNKNTLTTKDRDQLTETLFVWLVEFTGTILQFSTPETSQKMLEAATKNFWEKQKVNEVVKNELLYRLKKHFENSGYRLNFQLSGDNNKPSLISSSSKNIKDDPNSSSESTEYDIQTSHAIRLMPWASLRSLSSAVSTGYHFIHDMVVGAKHFEAETKPLQKIIHPSNEREIKTEKKQLTNNIFFTSTAKLLFGIPAMTLPDQVAAMKYDSGTNPTAQQKFAQHINQAVSANDQLIFGQLTYHYLKKYSLFTLPWNKLRALSKNEKTELLNYQDALIAFERNLIAQKASRTGKANILDDKFNYCDKTVLTLNQIISNVIKTNKITDAKLSEILYKMQQIKEIIHEIAIYNKTLKKFALKERRIERRNENSGKENTVVTRYNVVSGELKQEVKKMSDPAVSSKKRLFVAEQHQFFTPSIKPLGIPMGTQYLYGSTYVKSVQK